GRARLRRGHRAGQGRPDRRSLPHRRPHLLRRRPAPGRRARPPGGGRRVVGGYGVTTGEAVPDRAGFARLARGSRLVPVTRRLLADGETPVGVYRKLAGGRPGTFLLESAEHGRS